MSYSDLMIDAVELLESFDKKVEQSKKKLNENKAIAIENPKAVNEDRTTRYKYDDPADQRAVDTINDLLEYTPTRHTEKPEDSYMHHRMKRVAESKNPIFKPVLQLMKQLFEAEQNYNKQCSEIFNQLGKYYINKIEAK